MLYYIYVFDFETLYLTFQVFSIQIEFFIKKIYSIHVFKDFEGFFLYIIQCLKMIRETFNAESDLIYISL